MCCSVPVYSVSSFMSYPCLALFIQFPVVPAFTLRLSPLFSSLSNIRIYLYNTTHYWYKYFISARFYPFSGIFPGFILRASVIFQGGLVVFCGGSGGFWGSRTCFRK